MSSNDSEIDENFKFLMEQGDHVKEEDEAIAENCAHVVKFLQELKKKKMGEYSQEATNCIAQTTKAMQEFLLDEVPKTEACVKEKKEFTLDKRLLKKRNSSDGIELSSIDSFKEESCYSRRSRNRKKKKPKAKSLREPNSSSDSGKSIDAKTMIKVLANKIDNRRTPVQSKFDGDNGECLREYLCKFEKYC